MSYRFMKLVVLILTSFILAVWLLGYLISASWFDSLESLFSGLALVGVVTAIFLQQTELHQNTEALLAQKEDMNQQWKEIKQQRFEATLFSMWNLHFQIRDSMNAGGGRGIFAFKSFVDYALQHAAIHMTQTNTNAVAGQMYTTSLIAVVKSSLNANDFITVVEPYVSSLKLIYNSIVQANLGKEAETRYIEIAQSYLTNYEVVFVVLYYNYLLSIGSEASLTDMYKGLDISRDFSYRLKDRHNITLVFRTDSSFL